MTTPAPIRLTRNSTKWFEGLTDSLSKAVDEYGLPDKPDWQPLADLSGQTMFEGIETYGDSTVIEGDQLVAPATVYVTLTYDPNSNEPSSFGDSYPARVFFSVDGNEVVVKHIEVDTHSFYE